MALGGSAVGCPTPTPPTDLWPQRQKGSPQTWSLPIPSARPPTHPPPHLQGEFRGQKGRAVLKNSKEQEGPEGVQETRMGGRMAEDAVTRIFHKTRRPVARLQSQREKRQARKMRGQEDHGPGRPHPSRSLRRSSYSICGASCLFKSLDLKTKTLT